MRILVSVVLIVMWIAYSMCQAQTIIIQDGSVMVSVQPNGRGIIVGSGTVKTKDFDFTDFSGVEISSSFTVKIAQSDKYRCSITADDNIIERIQVTKNGSNLRISLGPGAYQGTSGLNAEVFMPDLVTLKLSGAARASVSGFHSGNDLEIDLSGGSNLDGKLEINHARIYASGGTHLLLEGGGREITVKASGASKLNLGSFQVDSARVELNGASSASVDVKKKLSFRLSGASNLNYRGNPRIGTAEAAGASSVSGGASGRSWATDDD